jgi:predicted lipid-binding transport protein (Tim44 family)
MIRFLRPLAAIVGVLGVVTLLAVDASDARPKGSMGSRGSRTQAAPPATPTAPTTARPMERTATPAQPGAAARTAAPAGAAAKPGLFSRPGFMGGIMAGMLGAGLLGLLFGQGLFGNLGGLASILGLVVQLALIGGVAYLLVRWWKGRSQPQTAMAGVPSGMNLGPAPTPMEAPKPMQSSSNSGYGASSASGQPQQQSGQPTDEIGIKPEDYEVFERLLGEVQTSYGKEDITALRARVTPEMMTYLSEELSDNASRGVVAKLSNVKLLQGDLSEAWAEGAVEYATVALRYEIVDTLLDRNTQRIVEGDPTKPAEVVELWTFTRSNRGGNWLLSAIQQVDDEQQPQA